jgi:P pilus assembly chaperone PapD
MFFHAIACAVSRFTCRPQALLAWLVGAAASLLPVIGQADTVIETTRIIYPEARRDVSFKITNASKTTPSFVQMWLDDGNANSTPEEISTPFSLTPPIARLKADGSQVVRVVFTGDALPADRESVFWFNMLEVPPKSKEETRLSFAVRTRIKMFYRPKALKGDPIEWMDKVSWKVVKGEKGWMAEASNPSNFHMSMFSISLGTNGKYDVVADGGMVNPKDKASFPLTGTEKMDKITHQTLRVEYVNDYGGAVTKELPIVLNN